MKKVLLILVVMMSLVFAASLSHAEFDLGATSVGSESGMDIHGYYEFEYWDTQGKNETFDAHKVVIWMGKSVVPNKVYVSAEFEWEHFPRHNNAEGNGVDVGGDNKVEPDHSGGDGEIKLDSAQVSITPNKTCRAYVGVFYVPFGIEYESYPGHKNKLITRPNAFKKGVNGVTPVIPGTWSDVGIGFEHKFENIGKLDLYAINGNAKDGGYSRDTGTNGNRSKSLGARISLDGLAKGLNVGVSYVAGRHNPTPDADTEKSLKSDRLGYHLKANISELLGGGLMDLALISEYVSGTDEADPSSDDIEPEGYYVQLSIRLLDKLEVAARYDAVDPDTKVSVANRSKSTSIGIGYDLYDNTKLKVEYQANGDPGANGEADKDDVVVVGLVVDW